VYNNRGCTSVGRNIAPWDSFQSPMTNLDLPFFPDANIIDVTSPAGWTESTLNSDPFNLGNGAETLDWSGTLAPLDALGGFSYIAAFAPVKASFEESFLSGATATIDPLIPGSPDALKGRSHSGSSVINPGTVIGPPSVSWTALSGLCGATKHPGLNRR